MKIEPSKTAPNHVTILSALLALLWLAGVISFYFVNHKPFSPALALNLTVALWQLLTAGLIVVLGGGIGKRVFSGDDLDALPRAAVQAALGLGILSLLILLTGLSVGANLIVMASIVIMGILFFGHSSLDWLRSLGEFAHLWRVSGRLGRMIAFALAVLFLLTLTTALAPPLKFDTLVYHIALPRAYLEAGKISYMPENMFSGMPQIVHMLYLLAYTLGGAPAAALVIWWLGVLTLLGLLGVISQHFNPRSAWIGVASLMAGYSLASSLAWIYVDWATMLWGLAVLICLGRWKPEKESQSILVAGLLLGMLIGIKYTAGVVLVAAIPFVIRKARRARVNVWRPVVLLGIMAVLLTAPWLIKNGLTTGNPLYPFGFPSGSMSEVRLALYQGQPVEGDWRDLVFLPFTATFWGRENAQIIGSPGYISSLGPLLLSFGVLAALGWRRFSIDERRFVADVGIFALTGLLVWGIAGRISGHLIRTHLYFALFPAFTVLAAAGFENLARLKIPDLRVGRIAAILVMLVLTFNAIQVAADTFENGAITRLLGLHSNGDYLAQNLGWYAPAMQAINELPEDARVLMLWEARSFNCLPRCEPDETIDRWLDDQDQFGLPAAILQQWRSARYSHLLYYQTGANFTRQTEPRYQPTDWAALDTLLDSLPAGQDFGGAYVLYSLEKP